MSRQVAALVYSRKCGSMSRKAVLAYFAERANDDGAGVWASKQRIADEVECSKQTVIAVVKTLVADGLLIETGRKKTQGGATIIYMINLAAVRELPPAQRDENDENQSSELTASPEKESSELTGQKLDRSSELTPSSQTALPKPSLNRPNTHDATHHVYSATEKSKREKHFVRPDWADNQHWTDFMANRKRKRLPDSATAFAGFLSDIAELADDEWPPGRLLEHAAAKGWGSINKPDETKGYGNGRSGNNGAERNRTTGAVNQVLAELRGG